MAPWEQLSSTVQLSIKQWQSSWPSPTQLLDFPGSLLHVHNFLETLKLSQQSQGPQFGGLFGVFEQIRLPFAGTVLSAEEPRSKSLNQKVRLPFAGLVLSSESRLSRGLDGAVQDVGRERQEEEEEVDETRHDEQNQTERWSWDDQQFGRGLMQLTAEVTSDGAGVTKEDLGRATWTFLHTLAAQYPEKPTRQQQRDVKELMSIMTRLYPCKQCAEHFKEVLKSYPVKAGSGFELAQWMCQVHNVVNRSLGKSQFNCQRVDARWGELNCDEGACDLEGRLLYK